MNDRPTVDELLEAVRDYLLTEVAPTAPDHRGRFRALICANVLAIVRRELASGATAGERQAELRSILALLGEEPVGAMTAGHVGDPGGEPREALVEANRRLAEHIRTGAADSGDHARAVRDVVRAQVERKLAVSNPGYLQRFANQGH